MNLSQLRLEHVQAIEIKGSEFEIDDKAQPGFQAKFNLDFVSDISGLSVGDEFKVRFKLSTYSAEEQEDPFFYITIIGTFSILHEEVTNHLETDDGAYSVGAIMFPYIRHLAKPILEYLGASDINFPFYPPTPQQKPESSPTTPTKAKPPKRPRKIKTEQQ